MARLSILDDLAAMEAAGAERVPISATSASSGLTATAVGIWPKGGLFEWPMRYGGETIEIVSSDAADSTSGAGCQMVEVQVMKYGGAVHTFEVELDGTAAVALDDEVINVVYARGTRWGATGTAVGNIDVRTVEGYRCLLRMKIGQRDAQAGRYMIPQGKIGILRWWAVGLIGTDAAEVFLCHDWSAGLGRHVATPRPVEVMATTTSGWVTSEIMPMMVLPPETRIEFIGRRLGSTDASGAIKTEITLIDSDRALGSYTAGEVARGA